MFHRSSNSELHSFSPSCWEWFLKTSRVQLEWDCSLVCQGLWWQKGICGTIETSSNFPHQKTLYVAIKKYLQGNLLETKSGWEKIHYVKIDRSYEGRFSFAFSLSGSNLANRIDFVQMVRFKFKMNVLALLSFQILTDFWQILIVNEYILWILKREPTSDHSTAHISQLT